MNLGPLEVIVIFVVALLVFGPNKLPEMGRQVGKAVREFRKFQSSFNNEFRDFLDEPSPQNQQRQPNELTRADREAGAGDTASTTPTPSRSGPGPAAASGPAVPLRPAGGDEESGSGNGDEPASPPAGA